MNKKWVTFKEKLVKITGDDLHQCPCCPATKCVMDEPCLGCETYGEWLRNEADNCPTEEEYNRTTLCDACANKEGCKIKSPGHICDSYTLPF